MKKLEYFICAPQLTCLSRSTLSLAISHFANTATYNTLDPDLSLALLRAVKAGPKTFEMLMPAAGSYKASDIRAELKRLISARYIFSSEDVTDPTQSSPGVNLFGRDASARAHLARILAESEIEIWDMISAGDELAAHLRDLGFANTNSKSVASDQNFSRLKARGGFVVVLGAAEHQTPISNINRILRKQDTRWLLVLLDEFGGIVGPTFGVKGGACFDCLIDGDHRSFSGATSPFSPKNLLESEAPPKFAHNPLARNVLSFVGPELIKILSSLAPVSSTDGFFALDLFNLRTRFSPVHPSPTCPVCKVQAEEKIAKRPRINPESRRV